MTWQPKTLWDYLNNKEIQGYLWQKEIKDYANCYVCYCEGKEVGFIPIEYDETDLEWRNWWLVAYKRFPEGLTIRKLMQEIMNRHSKGVD